MKTVSALKVYSPADSTIPAFEDSRFQSMSFHNSQSNYSHSSTPWSKVSTLKIVCVGFSSAHSETICHAGGMRQNSFTEQMFIEY